MSYEKSKTQTTWREEPKYAGTMRSIPKSKGLNESSKLLRSNKRRNTGFNLARRPKGSGKHFEEKIETHWMRKKHPRTIHNDLDPTQKRVERSHIANPAKPRYEAWEKKRLDMDTPKATNPSKRRKEKK